MKPELEATLEHFAAASTLKLVLYIQSHLLSLSHLTEQFIFCIIGFLIHSTIFYEQIRT